MEELHKPHAGVCDRSPRFLHRQLAITFWSVDNSYFDVPRLVRGIQEDLTERNMLETCSKSLDPANKSRDVGTKIMSCQQALVKLSGINFCQK